MSRRRSWPPLRRAGGAALVLLIGAGCPSGPPNAPDAGPRHAQDGVKVPLPAGWVVHAAVDQTFRAGPPGRSVLRIEARPAQPRLPTPESLRDMFIQEGKDVAVKVHSEQTKGDLTAVVLELTRQKEHASLLLGVKRSGKEWFFCSSEPGSTDSEVLKAAEACEGLTAP